MRRVLQPAWYRGHWPRIAAYVALAIAMGVGLWKLSDQNGQLKDQGKRLNAAIHRIQASEKAQAAARAENRERFRDSDRANCREIEKVKAQLREIVAFNAADTRLTLEQLNIDPDSARGMDLIRRSKEAADKALALLSARTGGCKSLPSADASEPKPK